MLRRGKRHLFIGRCRRWRLLEGIGVLVALSLCCGVAPASALADSPTLTGNLTQVTDWSGGGPGTSPYVQTVTLTNLKFVFDSFYNDFTLSTGSAQITATYTDTDVNGCEDTWQTSADPNQLPLGWVTPNGANSVITVDVAAIETDVGHSQPPGTSCLYHAGDIVHVGYDAPYGVGAVMSWQPPTIPVDYTWSGPLDDWTAVSETTTGSLQCTPGTDALCCGPPLVATVEPHPAPVQVGEDVTVTGKVTGGCPGRPITLQWTQGSGPQPADIKSPSSPSTEVSFPAAGSYLLVLTGSDGVSTASAGVSIQVQDPQISSVTFGGDPVVWDEPAADPNGQVSGMRVTQLNPCEGPQDADWEACQGAEEPSKVWPVIVECGSRLTITDARFWLPDIKDAKGAPFTVHVTASVTGAGDDTRLTFEHKEARETADGLEVQGLESNQPLPDRVDAAEIAIHWEVADDTGKTTDAGTTISPLFIVLRKPTLGQNLAWLSLLELTTSAASGQSDSTAVRDAIWRAFESRQIHRYTFDPTNGEIREGALLTYYGEEPWTLEDYIHGSYPYAACRTPQGPVNLFGTTDAAGAGVGRCGDWAFFFVAALNSQGLAVPPGAIKLVNPQNLGGPGAGMTLLLIKPWRFERVRTIALAGFHPQVGIYTDVLRMNPFGPRFPLDFDYLATLLGSGKAYPRPARFVRQPRARLLRWRDLRPLLRPSIRQCWGMGETVSSRVRARLALQRQDEQGQFRQRYRLQLNPRAT